MKVRYGVATNPGRADDLKRAASRCQAIADDCERGWNGRQPSPEIEGYLTQFAGDHGDVTTYITRRDAGTLTAAIISAACLAVVTTCESELDDLYPTG